MASTTIAVPTASAPVVVTTIHKEEDGGDPLAEWNVSDTAGSDGTAGNPGDGEALEETPRSNGINGSSSGGEECALCEGKLSSPRLLSCLHVFCEACLDKLLIDETDETIKGSALSCPICGQRTSVGARGAASLPCDYVLTNILDMSAIENMTVLCTSCKAKESAVARCSDCANFLCPNCNTAHQFMRCFESHKVIAFEDLKRSNKTVPIHKPIFCDCHPAENIKFYCYTCQEPICNECLMVEHKTPEHQYERLSDAESSQIEELVNLMSESKNKITECDKTSSHLENALSELQAQHDQAKDLIIETFQSYKAILEKCRDNALNDLEKLHSERELEVMDTFHNVEKSAEKIEDACRFTSRLLEHGDSTEILALKRTVATQLMNLINNTPKSNIKYSIEFQTDFDNFEKFAKESFGKFKTESTPAVKPSPEIITTMATCASQQQPQPQQQQQQQQMVSIPCPNSISTNSSMSLPTSMQSSFEGDTFIIPPPTSSPQNVPAPPPPVSLPPGPSMHGFTSIQEYNLQQLASLAEKVDLNDTSVVAPSANPSPTPSFTLADLLAGEFPVNSTSHAINNLQALAKLEALRSNSMANQDLGNPTLNGGGGLVLGRVQSPVMNESQSLGSLSANTLLNSGYQSLSNSTSPILSQGPDDLKSESMHNMPGVGNSAPGTGAGNYNTHPRATNSKQTPMQIRSKFGQLGPSKGQFNSPHGFCLGTDEDIIVADTNNHRIQIFDKTGEFKSQFGIPGKEEGQLWYPRKVAVMRNCGKFVVCDRGNERSRMQIFTKNGHFIKKIAIRYIDIVAGLAVTSQGHIVAVDSVSPTVFVISDTGNLLSWFDCSDYMREPSDIAISGKEFFVCDFKGHCVVVFNEDGHFLRRIGCENITNFPNGIDISDAGDVLIGDSHGNRFHVAVFSRDGSLISEFECPYVKVSRCCGLKITSEGYIVTLAKNNHHVLVLNTLYIL
ncbi:B-box type zinc finger protein ncl-1 [Microplitis demolitor]|uniref:B-box type zinc finger protein ncl-1 n=1 Tax=Microplitis demolitor TaxID=69319 RepID=UPI00043FFDF6|nr:B-box type zinc finger protein ncl-1 [Microplitis demolitor]XP_053598244.1 B-box type zinc finger protein ncl-1 [Microplitis demolitor]